MSICLAVCACVNVGCTGGLAGQVGAGVNWGSNDN